MKTVHRLHSLKLYKTCSLLFEHTNEHPIQKLLDADLEAYVQSFAPDLSPVLLIWPLIFTARRLAKRGICRRRVSVCMCVHHTLVLYQNG